MKTIIWSIAIIFLSIHLIGQTPTISGTIVDQNTNEPLVGAVVKHISSGKEVITDFDGNFTIEIVEAGINKLSVSYISYQDAKLNHVVVKDGEATELNIKLKRAGQTASSQMFLAQESKAKKQS